MVLFIDNHLMVVVYVINLFFGLTHTSSDGASYTNTSEVENSGAPAENSKLWQFQVTDAIGADLSHRLTILQPKTPSLDKRESIRYITTCTMNYVFRQSLCNTMVDNQEWTIFCVHPVTKAPISRVGRCAPDEICNFHRNIIPNPSPQNPSGQPGEVNSLAYCMKLSDYIVIKQTHHAGQALLRLTQALQPGMRGGAAADQESATLVLTGSDPTIPMNASSLQLAAQQEYELYNTVIGYKTLPGGLEWCEDCGRVQMDPVPSGADLFTARVVLPVVGSEARLYLL